MEWRCRAAVGRFRSEARAHGCIGRLAAARRRVHLAVMGYQEAVRLAPDSRRYAEALAQQYQRRLFRLISQEQLDAAHGELARIQRFYKRAKKRFRVDLEPPIRRPVWLVRRASVSSPAAKAFVDAARATFADPA